MVVHATTAISVVRVNRRGGELDEDEESGVVAVVGDVHLQGALLLLTGVACPWLVVPLYTGHETQTECD